MQYKRKALQEKFFEQDEKIRKGQEFNGEFVSQTLFFFFFCSASKNRKLERSIKKLGKNKNNEVCAREMQRLIYYSHLRVTA